MFLNKIFLKDFFLFAVCIVNTGQAFEPIPDHVKLSIFNIGQGNFILMKKAKNGIIIDAGTWKSPHDLSLTTKSIARDFEDVTINTVVVTHIDKDHWDLMEKTKGGKVQGYELISILLPDDKKIRPKLDSHELVIVM